MANYRSKDFQLFTRENAGATVWYFYTYNSSGKRVKKSTGIGYSNKKDRAKTKRQAAAYCEQLLEIGVLKASEEPTLKEWYELNQFWDWYHSPYIKRILARSPKNKPNITKSYCIQAESSCRLHLIPTLGHKIIDSITPADCENLIMTWSESMSNKSANNHRSIASRLFGEYERRRKMKKVNDDYFNPWRLVEGLGKDSTPIGGLTVEEARKILDRSKVSEFRNRLLYFNAMELAFHTGMRIGEIVGIWTDDVVDVPIQQKGQIITMSYLDVKYQQNPRTRTRELVKNKETRQIPISGTIRERIEQYMKGPHRYLFSYHPTGEAPLTHGAIADWFYQHLVNVGVVKNEDERKMRRISFHSSRRFFNTLLRHEGVPDDILRKFTGHSSREMTDHYTDYLPEDMKTIMNAQSFLLTENKENKHE